MIKDKTKRKKDSAGVKDSVLWGLLLFAVLIFIDQLTKALADAYQPRFDIIKGWVSVTIVYNPGISFGLGDKAPEWIKIAVIAVTGVMMAALAVLYFKVDKRRTLIRVALVFVVAGGVGNLIDRVYYKVWTLDSASANLLQRGVRDMVDVSRFGFAVCNFADFFITAGAIMLVLSFLFFDKDAFFPVGKYKEMHLAEEESEKEELPASDKTAE